MLTQPSISTLTLLSVSMLTKPNLEVRFGLVSAYVLHGNVYFTRQNKGYEMNQHFDIPSPYEMLSCRRKCPFFLDGSSIKGLLGKGLGIPTREPFKTRQVLFLVPLNLYIVISLSYRWLLTLPCLETLWTLFIFTNRYGIFDSPE